MLYNIDIEDSIYDSILSYLYRQTCSFSRDYSNYFILTPSHYFSYLLKKKFKEGIILPLIIDHQKVVEKFALEKQKFEYVHFRTKAIINTYKFRRKIGRPCSINEAALLLAKLEHEENNATLLDEAKEQLQYLKKYREFQKEALSEVFSKYERVITAGIYITDTISEHIYRKSIQYNSTIFIQGLLIDENYQPEQKHFSYKTWKFCASEPIEVINQNKRSDSNFFPQDSSSGTSSETKYEIKIHQAANDYYLLREVENHLLDLSLDVALVTKNQLLLKKIQSKLAQRGIPLFLKEKYKTHSDGIFLLKLVDLAVLGTTDENLMSLLKHPYIYEDNSSLIDEIERSFLRIVKVGAADLEETASTYLENIKKAAEKFNDAKNLAKYHLEWATSLTGNLGMDAKKILRFIENQLSEWDDIHDYKDALTFFLENHYFYPCEKNSDSIEVFLPKEASFLDCRNVLLLDCTEEDFPISDPQVMLNLFQIISTKKTIAISNKQKNLSRLLLKIQHSNQDKECSAPITDIAPILIEKDVNKKNQLNIPLELLPKKLNPTMIELLINSPYKFYLRYILGVKEVNPIGIKPSYRELGCILHNVFRRATNERFSKNEYKRILLEELEKYTTQYPYVKNLWLPRGLKILEQFTIFHNERLSSFSRIENEKEASISFEDLNGIELCCRFDRIESLDEDTATIVEFKTGVLPTLKQIRELVKPQLLLQGLILHKNRSVEIKELLCCKPSVDKISIRKIPLPMEEIESFQHRIKALLRFYYSGDFNFLEENMFSFIEK